MAARVIWKGSISFGLVHIPVGLYSAEQSKELSFSLLDKRDMAPVGYRRINKTSGKEVSWDDIVKGYEYEKDQYVILGPEDFKQANVQATQTVDIVDFVDASEIHPMYFEKPYVLEPVKKGEKSYALLRETLTRTGKIGVANVVIHTRQHLAAVLPRDNVLVLNLLRFENELRDISQFSAPPADLDKLGVTKKELDMAAQLVEGMTEKWQPEKYHDTYRDDLMALIDEKVKSGHLEAITEAVADDQPRKAEVIDLMALLKRSVEEKTTHKQPPKSEPKRAANSDTKPAKRKKSA